MGRLQLVARLLVVVLGATVLVLVAGPAVHSARMGLHAVRTSTAGDAERVFREQLEYLGDELDRQVPSGSRALIVEDRLEWRLRLSELATLHGIVAVFDHPDVEVRVRDDPAAPHGIRLNVTAVPR